MYGFTPPDYSFCPFCGMPLESRSDGESDRKYCAQDRWFYYSHMAISSSAVVIKDGKILMVQRAREPRAGTWMFPAGFCDYGEHPEMTALRELQEETGLAGKSAKLWKITQLADDPREPGSVHVVYEVIADDGELKVDPRENSAAGWFDIMKPPEVAIASHQEIIEDLQKRVR